MSQANNLLSMLADPGTQHTHAMADSDPYFVIDPNTRIMSNGSNEPIRIMQYDHNSVVLTFELPRFVDGHDMMLCNRVLVHWNNISEFTIDERAESTDIYDLRINPKDKSTVVCSWTVSRNSTQYAGNLSFLVQYKCVENDVTTYEWHTDIYTNAEIRQGRSNSEQSVIEYTEVIEQWYNRLFGEGKDSVIADIATAAEAQKASIAVKGEEVLATIPEEYTETYNMAKFATRTRANAIVVTAEGDSVRVDDSSDDNLRGLHVYGRTTQLKTFGTQLLNIPDAASKIDRGLTQVISNGACIVSGWANSNASFNLTLAGSYSGTTTLFTLEPGTYTATDCIISTYDGTTRTDYTDTFAITKEINVTWVSTRSYGASEQVNETTYPMLNVGSAALPWAPYSGGAMSPSPEWPQELVSVENTTVRIHGKNLLEPKGVEGAGYTAIVNADGSVTITGAANTTNAIYLTIAAPSTSKPLRLNRNKRYFMWGESSNGLTIGTKTQDSNGNPQWSDTTNWTKHLGTDFMDIVQIYVESRDHEIGDTSLCGTYHFQLEEGDSFTGFEGYKTAQEIAIPYTLHAVPVESGGTYTDANGQQWVADEIDFERGVHIQRVGVQTFNNAFEFINLSSLDGSGVFYCGLSGYDPSSYTLGMLSDQFKFKGYDIHNAGAVGHLTSGEFSYIRNPTAGARIYFAVDGVTNKEEATSWLAINQPTVYFPLKNYIETPLTEEELFAFSKLHSNATVTTAMNSENAYIGLVYNADTKTYFENTAASPERIQAAVDAWLTKHFSDAEGVSF